MRKGLFNISRVGFEAAVIETGPELVQAGCFQRVQRPSVALGHGRPAFASAIGSDVLRSPMGLTLVYSGNDRALALRDHLLPLIRQRGKLQVQRDVVRVISLEVGPWVFNHWTPFNELAPEQAASPGYRHALEQQRRRPDLPYGLEIWHGDKVLSVLWADHGAFAVDHFIRGDWEDEALALQEGTGSFATC